MITLQKLPPYMMREELGLSNVKIASEAGISVDTVTAVMKSAQNGKTINRSTATVVLHVFNKYRALKNLPPLEMSDLDWRIRGKTA